MRLTKPPCGYVEYLHAITRETVQLLRSHHPLTGDEDVGETLDVLDVDHRHQIGARFHLAREMRRHRRNPLGDTEALCQILTGGGDQIVTGSAGRGEDDALGELTAEPHSLHAVLRRTGKLSFQAELGDEIGGKNSLLGNVAGQIAGDVTALGDNGTVATHLRQLEGVGIGMRQDD